MSEQFIQRLDADSSSGATAQENLDTAQLIFCSILCPMYFGNGMSCSQLADITAMCNLSPLTCHLLLIYTHSHYKTLGLLFSWLSFLLYYLLSSHRVYIMTAQSHLLVGTMCSMQSGNLARSADCTVAVQSADCAATVSMNYMHVCALER